MELAQKYLKNPEISITRVAFECGYTDPQYFGILFKKYVGTSPKNYQRNYQKV